MDIESKVNIFEEKIEEYFLSCLPREITRLEDKSFLKEWPLYKFNISSIYRIICDNNLVFQELLNNCADKLIDIKLIYCYLYTTIWHFYRGVTEIVGNNRLERLNPNTISLLRENHYKVYLISVVIENLLDLFQLIFSGSIIDYKKKKWEKILLYVKDLGVIDSLNDGSIKILLDFKDKYRTAELHKFSAVRAFTAKEKWDHFQVESEILQNIISDLTSFLMYGKR